GGGSIGLTVAITIGLYLSLASAMVAVNRRPRKSPMFHTSLGRSPWLSLRRNFPSVARSPNAQVILLPKWRPVRLLPLTTVNSSQQALRVGLLHFSFGS